MTSDASSSDANPTTAHAQFEPDPEQIELAAVIRAAIGTPPAGKDFLDAAADVRTWMLTHGYVRLGEDDLERVVEAVREREGDDGVAALHAARAALGWPQR